MTIERVKNAAYLRNIFFDGVKKWRNNTIGYAYEIYTVNGFYQSDTLTGLYAEIMKYPKTNN